jgi:hypothetical protein
VLHPVVVYSDRGTGGVEQDNQIPYQWTGASTEIDVHNFGRVTIDGVRLTFSLAAPDSQPRRFTIQSPGGEAQVVDVEGGTSTKVEHVVNAAPGGNQVTISTTGDAVSRIVISKGNAVNKIVFGKLIDLRASAPAGNGRFGVVQQRVG